MTWWPWKLEARVDNLEKQLDAVWQYLENLAKGTDMSQLHDRMKDLADRLDAEATTTIANATENETGFQDIITQMETTIEKLKKKNADDASSGSSTGGESGARS
jgi:uncharacterized coiled-coil protein SlyX